MSTHSVLVVDDDQMLRDTLCDVFSDWGCHILSADCGLKALELLSHEQCELMISDVDMPDISGFELLSRIRKQDMEFPCILMSARANDELKTAATQAGALAMLKKPLKIQHVNSLTKNIFHL